MKTALLVGCKRDSSVGPVRCSQLRAEIAASLIEGEEYGFDPEFCVSVIEKLLLRATKDPAIEPKDYARALNIACNGIVKKRSDLVKHILTRLLAVLDDSLIARFAVDRPPYLIAALEGSALRSTESLIAFIAVVWGTITHIIDSTYPPPIYALYPNIWSKITLVTNLSLEVCPSSALHILQCTSQLYHRSPPVAVIYPCIPQSDHYISVLLQSIRRIILELSSDLPEHLFHELSINVKTWLVLFPPSDLTDIASITNALEGLINVPKAVSCDDLEEIIFQVAVLLMNNHVPLPWFEEYMDNIRKRRTPTAWEDEFSNELMEKRLEDDLSINQRIVKRLRLESSEQMDLYDSNPILDAELEKTDQQEHSWLHRVCSDLWGQALQASSAEDIRKALKEIRSVIDMVGLDALSVIDDKDLAEFAVDCLAKDIKLAEIIASFFDLKLPRYFNRNMRHILPHAAGAADAHLLDLLASVLQVSVLALYQNGAHHLLVGFLLAKDESMSDRGFERLCKAFSSDNAPAELLSSNQNKVVTFLAMELGNPKMAEKAQEGLSVVIRWLKAPTTTTAGDLLSKFFLGIIDKITTFVTEKRTEKKRVKYPYALRSLERIIIAMGNKIESHTHQAMAIFQTVGELEDMQPEALRLWKCFAEQLSPSQLYMYIGTITQNLMSMFPQCDKDTKHKLASLLEKMLADCDMSAGLPEGLPAIPPFDELSNVRKLIEEHRSQKELGVALQEITERTRSDDALYSLAALQELYRLLQENGPSNPSITRNRGLLYSALLNLATKGFEQVEIQKLTAECLGLLGASDPSQIDVAIAEENIPLLKNFKDPNETRDFICRIIVKFLIPAFHTSIDERVRQSVQYAIQKELSHAGFTPTSLVGKSANSAAIKARWDQFPSRIQSLLAPLLWSSFQGKWNVPQPSYPIYPSAQDYSEWLKRWFYKLAEAASADAMPIFIDCFPVINYGNLSLALTLLPHLVLHVLLSGDNSDLSDITQEIICVLEANANGGKHSEQMQRASLQVVVLIIEHCRRWLNDAQENAMGAVDIKRIREFLDRIPNEKMAIASFHSKSYPQALLYLELYMRSLLAIHGSMASDILDIFRQILAKLDDKDGVAAVFSMYKRNLTIEEEIMQFECQEDWKHAKVCYIEAFNHDARDPKLVSGYFNCQRMSRDYSGMLGAATQMLEVFPELFPRINAYRAEAAWKTYYWEMLDRATSLPMEETFDSFLARAIANIRRGKDFDVLTDIESARKDQMGHLMIASRESYNHSHDYILRLQMLHELEESHAAWQTVRQTGSAQAIKELQTRWKEQFNFLAPSYRVRREVLELRIAGLYDLKPDDIPPSIAYDDGSTWMKLSKVARKAGDLTTALRASLNAEAVGAPFAYMERAKWLWANNEQAQAVQYMELHSSRFDAKAALLFARFTDASDTREKNAVMQLYRRATRMNQSWEKAFYSFGSFYDRNWSSRDIRLLNTKHFRVCVSTFTSYLSALTKGSKYFYKTMPRVLTIWMQFTDAMSSSSDSNSPARRTEMAEAFMKINTSLLTKLPEIEPYKFHLVLPRLVSRLSHNNQESARALIEIITKVFLAYPRTAIWALQLPLESSNPDMSSRTRKILTKAVAAYDSVSLIPTIIRQAREFMVPTKELAFYNPIDTARYDRIHIKRFPQLMKIKNFELCIPTQQAMTPPLPEADANVDYSTFSEDLPRIDGFGERIDVMFSLQRPKKISIIGSDGKDYHFLCKTQDDLRKDARMMEFSHMINMFLRKDTEARQRRLYIRTYGVTPLGEQWGLIEWVNNLQPLKQIVLSEWQAMNIDYKKIASLVKAHLDDKNDEVKAEAFLNIILPKCPAVFHKWFLNRFPDPTQWFAGRSHYVKTLAVMSIVGYILGLGDRHAENILFDRTNGDCVHVDVNMLFDRGQALTVPEIVPFRLTHNLIDGMGATGYEGMFRKTCEVTLQVLRDNKVQLLSVFETLVHDPIVEWKKHHSNANVTPQMKARKQMETIENKISQDKTVRENVQLLIAEATDHKKLARMFIGWAPYI
ncbi:hypothetical protein BX666DRAFT_1898360 [Dichotomocladium elegans]|nr:hypothetical protein BX666DRAFT_1898360 [Dichotomocladium elegans]